MNQKYKYERIQFSQNQRQSNINILRYVAQFLVLSTTKTLKNTSIAPFQTIKIILRIQKHLSQNNVRKQFLNESQLLKKCIKQQGILSLWRGNLLQALQVFMNQFIITLMKIIIKIKKEKLQYEVNNKYRNIQWIIYNIFQKLSEIISFFICYPLRLLRILSISKLFNKNKNQQSIFTIIQRKYANQGIYGFYKGALLSFCKQNLEMGLIKILTKIKEILSRKILKLKNIDPLNQFLTQKFIQLLAKIIIYPLESMINIFITNGKNNELFSHFIKNLTLKELLNGINVEIFSFLFLTFALVLYDNLKSQKLSKKNNGNNIYH